MHLSHHIDKTLDDTDIERLEHHIEVKDLTLGHPMGINIHVTFDWLCLDSVPSPFRISNFILDIQNI